jgi:hypothetical protein
MGESRENKFLCIVVSYTEIKAMTMRCGLPHVMGPIRQCHHILPDVDRYGFVEREMEREEL